MIAFRSGMPAGSSLVASCFDTERTIGGGLFAFSEGYFRRLDTLSTTGMDTDGHCFVRVLWSEHSVPCHVLWYDELGLARSCRVERASNPHDLRLCGGEVVLVATAENEIIWLDAVDGRERRRWSPSGEPDSWHLNGVLVHESRVLACAFGRFERTKGWDLAGRPATGIVLDVESGADVLRGLCAPHSPRYVDDRWVLCNSARSELVSINPSSGRIVQRVALGGWTRGLAVGQNFLFVGVSAGRHSAAPTQGSRVAMIDKATFEVLDEFEVAGRELYDLAFVPTALIEALARGPFNTMSRQIGTSPYVSPSMSR